VTFGPLAFHRGVQATEPGWRPFIRLTESNHFPPANEIRVQTQVYLTDPFYEWCLAASSKPGGTRGAATR
jgi:hypothetical protein